jgi:ElaB/YqjD/DUF883 family membrane-anchored ribosome-binding protein
MSREKKLSLKELQEKKKKLDMEIKLLEKGFAGRAEKAKAKIDAISNPAAYIRKHPFRTVAIAAGAGLVTGLLKPKRRQPAGQAPAGRSHGITSVFLEELRHLAVRKAMLYLSDLIDQQMADFQKNKSDKK